MLHATAHDSVECATALAYPTRARLRTQMQIRTSRCSEIREKGDLHLLESFPVVASAPSRSLRDTLGPRSVSVLIVTPFAENRYSFLEYRMSSARREAAASTAPDETLLSEFSSRSLDSFFSPAIVLSDKSSRTAEEVAAPGPPFPFSALGHVTVGAESREARACRRLSIPEKPTVWGSVNEMWRKGGSVRKFPGSISRERGRSRCPHHRRHRRRPDASSLGRTLSRMTLFNGGCSLLSGESAPHQRAARCRQIAGNNNPLSLSHTHSPRNFV